MSLRRYASPREVVEPVESRVEWHSPALPSSGFERDRRGRWHLTSWQGDSFVNTVEALRCPPLRWWQRWRRKQPRCRWRGWTWLELTLRAGPEGPVVVTTGDGWRDLPMLQPKWQTPADGARTYRETATSNG